MTVGHLTIMSINEMYILLHILCKLYLINEINVDNKYKFKKDDKR